MRNLVAVAAKASQPNPAPHKRSSPYLERPSLQESERGISQSFFVCDYFELFGLERSFRVEVSQLEDSYRCLLLKFHPDRALAVGTSGKLLALRAASRLNDAYKVLSDDVARATYLLELEGVASAQESTLSNVEFLSEQMDLREQIAIGKNSPAPLKSLQKLAERVAKRMIETMNAFAEKYQTKQFSEAEKEARKLYFFKKIKSEIKSGLRGAKNAAAPN